MKSGHSIWIEDHNKLKFESEKNVKAGQRARLDLENEVRNLSNATQEATRKHTDNILHLERDKAKEEKLLVRHLEEVELFKKMKLAK